MESRRLLIASGTGDFINQVEGIDKLKRVPDEISDIVQVFSSLGYQRQATEKSLNPDSNGLRRLFTDCRKSTKDGDIVVAYYTGHGHRDDDRFYLLTQDTDLNDIELTAVAAEDLARDLVKGSQASQILVILDACLSGAGASEFANIANRFASQLGSGPSLYILAAARSKQEAQEGVLSAAILEALTNHEGRLGGHALEFLPIDEVKQSIKDFIKAANPSQTATWSHVNDDSGRCRVFPNPRYIQGITPGLDLETQRLFNEHWLPKAKGVSELGFGGWYFTGRRRVLHKLVLWLKAQQSDGRARVVTGGAGRGKSAILARIVTLAEHRYRNEILITTKSEHIDSDHLPPDGCVDIALLARRKSLADVIRQIASGLELNAIDARSLVEQIAHRPHKTVIVIDALDEAEERDSIAEQLLKPLALMPNVFLLVGTRPDATGNDQRFCSLGESVEQIDLDAPQWVEPDDVFQYVVRRLLASEEPGRHTPYSNNPATATLVARALADRANDVFLVAQTATQALLADDYAVDISITGWAEQLPTGLEEAFRQFLLAIDNRHLDELTSSQVRTVLLPLAFAEGEGLPWSNLWSSAATSIANGEDITDKVIAKVINHAAAFIVESIEVGQSVYRLYHERLAEHLREKMATREDKPQLKIFNALLTRVPSARTSDERIWLEAHPYLKKHMASYAAKAGCLESLVADPAFLLCADPEILMRQMSKVEIFQAAIARSYRRAFGWMRGIDQAGRLPYLALALMQEGLRDMALKLSQSAMAEKWMPRWVCWEKPNSAYLLANCDTKVTSLATGHWPPENSVAIIGRECGGIEILQISDGRQLAEWSGKDRASVRCVLLTESQESPLLVASWADGRFGVRDLLSHKDYFCADNTKNQVVEAMCVIKLNGKNVCVTAHHDLSIAIWELPSLQLIKRKFEASRATIYALAAYEIGQVPMFISASDSLAKRDHEKYLSLLNSNNYEGVIKYEQDRKVSRLRLWSAEDLELLWVSDTKEGGCITNIELCPYHEQTYIVTSQNHWGPPEIWRVQEKTMEIVYRGDKYADTDRSWLSTSNKGAYLYSVAVSYLNSVPIKIIDGSIHASKPNPPRAKINGGYLSDLIYVDSNPCILSADNSLVYLWNLDRLLESKTENADHYYISAGVACLAFNCADQPILYCGLENGEIVGFDVDTGVMVSRIVVTESAEVSDISIIEVHDGNILIAAIKGILYIEPINSQTVEKRRIQAGDDVRRLRVESLQGRTLIFASVKTEYVWAIRIWDILTGEEVLTESISGVTKWRYQLSHGEEDKSIEGLITIPCGDENIRIVFSSKYSKIMVADYIKTEKTSSSPFEFKEWGIPNGRDEYVTALAFAKDSDGRQLLAAGTEAGNLAIWDFDKEVLLASYKGAHLGMIIKALALHSFRETIFIISGGKDGVVRFWNKSLNSLAKIEISSPITTLEFISQAELAVGTDEGVCVLEIEQILTKMI